MTGHDGSDKSTVSDRLNRYGRANGTSGENCSYGQKEGRAVVIQLLIDDNVPSRGHRENLFTPDFKVMGSFSDKHKKFDIMTVIDYAAGWRKKDEEDP